MKRKKVIDYTINDSCIICEVKTDGSVLCNKCLKEARKLRKNLKKKIKRDVA